jgi:hypothetical protein
LDYGALYKPRPLDLRPQMMERCVILFSFASLIELKNPQEVILSVELNGTNCVATSVVGLRCPLLCYIIVVHCRQLSFSQLLILQYKTVSFVCSLE